MLKKAINHICTAMNPSLSSPEVSAKGLKEVQLQHIDDGEYHIIQEANQLGT